MSILESAWFVVALLIIVIILSTDPKTNSGVSQSNQMTMFFSSISDSQLFLRRFTWLMIFVFIFLSILLSYFNEI